MLFLKPDVTKKNRELFFLEGFVSSWANISETIGPEMLVFGK